MVQPNFVSFNKNILFLKEKSVSKFDAEALKLYLIKTAPYVEKRVHKLVIDACGITDESFAMILDGVHGQGYWDVVSKRMKL